ncbi:glycoside hydrolase family 16 protein [Roridomyces roridus]|uniref:Glycoside hydrolase family 16 protein n=1 Tax=Roridomyces roridus TaxID=1738132 RepID=A0AAD7CBN8_9AGAR|nr:glycoside hydrolase family 16 protein [Roridomyces roridus]
MPSISSIALFSTLVSSTLCATTYDMVKGVRWLNVFQRLGFLWFLRQPHQRGRHLRYLERGQILPVGLRGPDDEPCYYQVDNTSTVPLNQKRNTVRISSKDEFEVGSVWIADMYHVPFGCSVWPAFWSQAPDWPTGGEIDTFEHWNMELNNQMTLHTDPGCNQVSPAQTSNVINSTDCSYADNSNAGCGVMDPNPSSYGERFAQAGGGVFVTEFAEAGISVWFFNRSSIPSSLSGNASSFTTDALGTPTANWPTGGCDIDTFFKAQNLIFDITLCGDAAGETSVFAQTCSGTCYNDYVVGNGSVYNNAYFDVASVRVYSVTGTNTTAINSAMPASRWTVTSMLALGGAVSLLLVL